MIDYSKQGLNEALVGHFKEAVLEIDADKPLTESVVAKNPENVDFVVNGAMRFCREVGKPMVDMIDFEYLIEQLMPQSVLDAFDSEAIQGDDINSQRVREHVASTIQSSAFDRLFDTCIPQILQNFSRPEAPFTIKQKITTPVTLDCRTQKVCEWIKPELPDLCCMGEDESTPYYGSGCLRCWKTPAACKIKFAMGYNREMLCVDPNGMIRDHIAMLAEWFDEMDTYALIKMLFNAEGCSATGSNGFQNCRFPFNYMDTEYNAYQPASANAPWTNLYEGAEFKITGCSDTVLQVIEKLWEDERDHCTGRPLAQPGQLQFFITSWAERNNFLRTMSARELLFSACGGAPCVDCGREDRVQSPAREGWSSGLMYDPYVIDILREYYRNCYSTLAADDHTADVWARNTYVVGDPRQALGFGTEWALESLERSGTDTWEYWDREVVYQRKFMRKATPLWLRPWAVKLFRAFETTPNPVT